MTWQLNRFVIPPVFAVYPTVQTNAILLYYNALTFVCYIPLLVALIVFYRFTGISFVDIKNLTEDNVAIISGSPWIVSQRQKTGVPFKIKLIDAAIQIIERYKPLRKDMHLFNIGSLDMVNKRIKKVAKMCGIKKRISFHVSRHSFAVLALNYGMPIESVSKILGHTDIATTQIYAKVTSTKLEHDISAFESRIKGHMPTMGGMA